tara:strand:- start:116 stop:1072 length:957 start_codon:yes stop_codon:yes gene_type:complete
MRQAGRYLPEFREIRKNNPNFIELCLNKNLTPEITLQPLERFELDAAIIFSDILMLPFGLGQKVEFKKNFGPSLGELNINNLLNTHEDIFSKKLQPVYEAIKIVSENKILNKKDLFGFVGAPWTLFVYMLNKQSPKLSNNFKNFFFDKIQEKDLQNLLFVIVKFLKLHIKNQVKNGASIIQIFDSWAGLLDQESYEKYIFEPTSEIVNYTKELGVPVICFPRNIKNYKKFCEIVKPDAISIDYETDPKVIAKEINIPIQGGLDPKVLLRDKDQLKKEAINYLEIFKDHPYIFNLGHGVLPETDPNMLDYLVKLIKDFK